MSDQPLEHHPQAPSILPHLDPKLKGCRVFVASRETHELAEIGSLQHRASASGDLSLLGGDETLIREVMETAEYFGSERFRHFDGEEFRELRVELPGINFGTVDLLRFNQKGSWALIGDAKFGAWSVTPALKNLQGMNYAAAVFFTYPAVHRITVAFYMAKRREASVHTFYRVSLPKMVTRIRDVVENAQRALKDPQLADFTPHPVNCGFCHRVNCPARLKLVSQLVTAWNGKPVKLPTLNLLALPTPQLGALKRLSNVIKTCAKAIDDECKRRAIHDGDIIEGYQLTTKWGSRTVVGAEALEKATKVLLERWQESYPDRFLPLLEVMKTNIELPMAKIEECASQVAPYGDKLKAQKLVFDTLLRAGVVSGNQFSYLIANKE
jgi:hypothetical protein